MKTVMNNSKEATKQQSQVTQRKPEVIVRVFGLLRQPELEAVHPVRVFHPNSPSLGMI
jgi:hypothetical protein